MAKQLNVIVTCTNSKTREVPEALRLREVRGRSIEERCEQWTSLLSTHAIEPGPARELYSGDHWYVSRDLETEGHLAGFAVRIWVCSAGYGLVPLEANLRPYSATFTEENPDAIRRFRGGVGDVSLDAQWWELLSRWKGPSRGEPRSVEALAARQPGTPILVVASPRYIGAMSDDLKSARLALRSSDLLSIFSAGSTAANGLAANLVPCDARLQNVVKGPRFSLNARAARMVIQKGGNWPLNAPELQQRFRRLMEQQPEIKKYERIPMTDEDVRAYIKSAMIKSAMKHEGKLSHTGLLRQLRAENRACEQKRFRDLFKEMTG